MIARMSLTAATVADARRMASASFAEFFGDTPWSIVSEQADATVVSSYGLSEARAATWDCVIEARAKDEAS